MTDDVLSLSMALRVRVSYANYYLNCVCVDEDFYYRSLNYSRPFPYKSVISISVYL